MPKFPHYRQYDNKDCGPTCLKIIAKYYKKTISLEQLRDLTETTRAGTSLMGLSKGAESIGFKSLGVKISLEKLLQAPLPCVLFWDKKHYVVLYKISKLLKKNLVFHVSDPAFGLLKFDEENFLKHWIGFNADSKTEEGVTLLLKITPSFFQESLNDDTQDKRLGVLFLSKYFFRYKPLLFQLLIGLFAGSLLQLIIPFFAQSIVDVGIRKQDIEFIYLILFAQLSLFIGKASVELIRNWLTLHISTRINILLVSDFFIKLMSLPIAFFDTRITGDILQRIEDHKRIEKILTTSSLNTFFQIINLIIFSIILSYYSLQVFFVFFLGSLFYMIWFMLFFKKRYELDYKNFSQIGEEKSKVIELINGMQEIKLHNAEKIKRWSWEYLQARLFKISLEGLKLELYQNIGAKFINELKNILATLLSAKLVIEGEITLGMMLAITYIIGKLNSPISDVINFIHELQDAKISLNRLSEIHNKEDEEFTNSYKIKDININATINIHNLSFRYSGSENIVLKNLNVTIPANKITAIVGASGSGKTTLMKLLLKFYNPIKGSIKLQGHELKNISQKEWRKSSGVVMQEGYIFNDTVANNIALGDVSVDKKKLVYATNIANISEFIESLPLSYNTQIGMEGFGLSTGQKQRLLIARAVYKNPKFLFFDEATSALDTNNEKKIINNLNIFFKNKTVVVIAHRLSTVKNADQIVVLDKGEIVEVGSHEKLIKNEENYYHLVKNQLELGK